MLSSEVQGPHSQIPQLVRVRISSPSLILLKPVPLQGKEQEVVSFPHPCHHQMTKRGIYQLFCSYTLRAGSPPTGWALLSTVWQGPWPAFLHSRSQGQLSHTRSLQFNSPVPSAKDVSSTMLLRQGAGPTLLSVAVGERQGLLSLVPQSVRLGSNFCGPVLMTFGDNESHGHQHRPGLQQGHWPRPDSGQQPRPRCHYGPR